MAERRPSLDFFKSLSIGGNLDNGTGEEQKTEGNGAERRPSLDFLRSFSVGANLGNGTDDMKRSRRSSMNPTSTASNAPAGSGAKKGRRSSMTANLGGRTNYDNPNDTVRRRSSAPETGKQQKRRGSFGSLTAFVKMETKETIEDGNMLYEAALKKAKAQEWEGAIRLFNRALIAQRKELGQDHPKVASTLNSIGVALTNLGETFGAMTAFQEALYIRQETLGAGHEDVVKTMNNIHKLLDVVQLIDESDDNNDDDESGDEGGKIKSCQVQNSHGLERYRDDESSDSEISTDSDDDSDLDDDDGLHVDFPRR